MGKALWETLSVKNLADSPHMIRALAAAGAPIDHKIGDETVLQQAAYYGHVAIVKQLLALGARPTDGAMTAACNCDSEDGDRVAAPIVSAMLAAGGNANAVVRANGWSLLHYAASCGYAGVVRALLAKGARKDVKDDKGRAPAELASSDALKTLLQ